MTQQKSNISLLGWIKIRKVELLALVVAALLVAIDQVTKLMVANNFKNVGDSVVIIDGVLNFTYVQNRGAVFGSLADMPYIFNTVTSVFVIAAIAALLMGKLKGNWLKWTASLVIAGGIGNMIDRLRLKYVIDFIDVKLFGNLWVWVFNFADCCVVIGGIMLIIYFIVDMIKDAKKAKTDKQKGDGDVDG